MRAVCVFFLITTSDWVMDMLVLLHWPDLKATSTNYHYKYWYKEFTGSVNQHSDIGLYIIMDTIPVYCLKWNGGSWFAK